MFDKDDKQCCRGRRMPSHDGARRRGHEMEVVRDKTRKKLTAQRWALAQTIADATFCAICLRREEGAGGDYMSEREGERRQVDIEGEIECELIGCKRESWVCLTEAKPREKNCMTDGAREKM